ncbi:hypothetical protein BDV93DRAFT_524318 [Ceratobasidium sp. AG-I]|nr:hypothetical protein BDV93DRAFT_524318 [Ceratobasidium sp. AG-I]
MSAQRRISNVIPLPGVHEIESVVTGLINAVKATGYEKDQCESLARRLDSLIAVTDACKEHADFAELLNLLQDVKSRFETKLKHKSKLPGVLRVQDRLRAYEHLSSELTELVERAQV